MIKIDTQTNNIIFNICPGDIGIGQVLILTFKSGMIIFQQTLKSSPG